MRSKTFNKSQLAILATARTLFWKYGVKKVSVEEIAKEAGISKMTFYRSFKNKLDLVMVMLTNLANEGFEAYHAIMSSNVSFPEKIKLVMLEKRKNSEGISQEFMRDVFMSEDKALQAMLLAQQEKSKKTILKDFTKAQKEGWIRQDLSMDFIMYMLDDIQAKAADSRFLELHKDNVEEAIMELTSFFFYGVMPIKAHKA